MPISAEFVAVAGDALAEHCPLASQDPETIEKIKSKILKYDEELQIAPPTDLVLSWAAPLEKELQEQADDQAAEVAQIEARKREREDYLSGADADKAQAERDLKERSRPLEQTAFIPACQYTQAEMDEMSSDEYAIKVLGRNSIADRNGVGTAPPDKTATEIVKKRILQSRNAKGSKADKQMRATLRREIREGLR